MIKIMKDLITNSELFSIVINTIKEHGFEGIAIYKSDIPYEKNALCFYVTPKKDIQSNPYIEALKLTCKLESPELLGCQIEITVKNQLPVEKEQEINGNAIDITCLDDKITQKLIDLYKDIKFSP